jgi:hypothetical protein
LASSGIEQRWCSLESLGSDITGMKHKRVPYLPSNPLTLDQMDTFDLVFKRTYYHQKASYRKMIRKLNSKKNFRFANSVLLIFAIWFTQRSYGSCMERFKLSMRSKARGFYGTWDKLWAAILAMQKDLIQNS